MTIFASELIPTIEYKGQLFKGKKGEWHNDIYPRIYADLGDDIDISYDGHGFYHEKTGEFYSRLYYGKHGDALTSPDLIRLQKTNPDTELLLNRPERSIYF